ESDLDNTHSYDKQLDELSNENNKYQSKEFLLKLSIKTENNNILSAKRLTILADSCSEFYNQILFDIQFQLNNIAITQNDYVLAYKVTKETGTRTQIINEEILKMNELADINMLPSYAIFTLPPKTREMSSSNQALSNCPQLLVNSSLQLLSQMLSQSSLQLFPQLSSQLFSQSLLQTPLQATSQISLQTNNFSSQPLNNFFLNSSNISLQMSPNVSLQISSNILLQMLPNIPLQIPPLYKLSSQLLPNISSQPYFMPFSIFPNL
ncbi:14499_t:CDS:2, partial [Racocetra persica]